MRIAIITSGFLPVIDGVTVSGMQRLQKLSQWGHQVLLFCPDYSALSHIYPDWENYTGEILPGIKVISLRSTPFMDLDFERNVSFFAYRDLMAALTTFQPDIIHVDEPERLFLGFWRSPGLAYARAHNIPCVSFFRTNFLEYIEDYFSLPKLAVNIIISLSKLLIISVYNSYDKTLVSSRVTHQKLLDLGIKNLQYENLLGFEPGNFRKCKPHPYFFREKYKIKQIEDRIKIIFLGRLTPDKGWSFTLQAFKSLQNKIGLEKIAIIIAGEGPTRLEIQSSLQQLQIEPYFLGRVPPGDVPELLSNCDIHVTTSEKETRGLTILEAFAAAIPVLAPNRGGVTENIVHGWNGYLYRPGDMEDFCQKLSTLIIDEALRISMGQRGRESVTQYSWEKTIQNLVNFWQSMIAEQRPKNPDRSAAPIVEKN
ncbi:glycosyltransferase [Lyngbya confervoides]|uniref:Glycosyltransferase n=1 Tax=Lyngbya confervoides BDU141951 TaxID=1574623 RepID=A0ABD4T8H6_9CYAN|nr:glycosyltransferase [Lyngbya confervoides]MCM1984620.1 glycosyltransferase [Lyngbya confervoides BDU141951]